MTTGRAQSQIDSNNNKNNTRKNRKQETGKTISRFEKRVE